MFTTFGIVIHFFVSTYKTIEYTSTTRKYIQNPTRNFYFCVRIRKHIMISSKSVSLSLLEKYVFHETVQEKKPYAQNWLSCTSRKFFQFLKIANRLSLARHRRWKLFPTPFRASPTWLPKLMNFEVPRGLHASLRYRRLSKPRLNVY